MSMEEQRARQEEEARKVAAQSAVEAGVEDTAGKLGWLIIVLDWILGW